MIVLRIIGCLWRAVVDPRHVMRPVEVKPARIEFWPSREGKS